MSRSVRRPAFPRLLVLAASLVLLAGVPAQAANTWTKILPTFGETQGVAAAPDGGVYVATSRTDLGAVATLFSYRNSGSLAWSTVLGASQTYVRDLASDSSGNAYVAMYVAVPDADGYLYRIQQVKKTGALGWVKKWHDADASLQGDVLSVTGGKVILVERDASSGITTVRKLSTTNGASSGSWSLSVGQGPTDSPVDVIGSTSATTILDKSGGLFRLRSNGTVQWKKQLPGTAYRGDLGVDSSGITVGYVKGFDARVRRYSLSGTQKWDKRMPGDGGSRNAATAAGGTSFTAAAKYVNDTVRTQIVVGRLDAAGKLKGQVVVGTSRIDQGDFILLSGDYLYIGGYQWASPTNKPILIRVNKP
ncbi:MAG: hypothetical protein LH650_01305 [Chloroflexi bacterium]|nr:hypothetical protein [Chloroflexota bacterium]